MSARYHLLWSGPPLLLLLAGTWLGDHVVEPDLNRIVPGSGVSYDGMGGDDDDDDDFEACPDPIGLWASRVHSTDDLPGGTQLLVFHADGTLTETDGFLGATSEVLFGSSVLSAADGYGTWRLIEDGRIRFRYHKMLFQALDGTFPKGTHVGFLNAHGTVAIDCSGNRNVYRGEVSWTMHADQDLHTTQPSSELGVSTVGAVRVTAPD